MANGFIGIDLGGTNTRLGLMGPKGLLALKDLRTRPQQGPEAWLERLAGPLAELQAAAGEGGLVIRGACLGAPGVLDREAGALASSANLPGWQGHPLAAGVQKLAQAPTALENDANLYALGEWAFGAGQGHDSLACLTLGTGVGGGIILDGRLLKGPLAMGGELGHLVIEPGGAPCACGAAGCLEAYASASGLKAALARLLAQGRGTGLEPGSGVKSMEDAALSGDGLAQGLFARAGKALGRAVAVLVNCLGLDLVIIGGGVARGWPLMEPACREELAECLRIVDPGLVMIKQAVLGDRAPVLGGAVWARNLYEGPGG